MIKSKKLFLNYGGLFDYISYSSKDIKLTFQIRAHGAYILQWEKLPCDVRIFFLKFFIRRNLIAQPYIVGFPLGFPIGISSSSQVATFQLFKTVTSKFQPFLKYISGIRQFQQVYSYKQNIYRYTGLGTLKLFLDDSYIRLVSSVKKEKYQFLKVRTECSFR